MMKRCISEQKKYEQTTKTAVMQCIFHADIIPLIAYHEKFGNSRLSV